jgi:hypothetical protein
MFGDIILETRNQIRPFKKELELICMLKLGLLTHKFMENLNKNMMGKKELSDVRKFI